MMETRTAELRSSCSIASEKISAPLNLASRQTATRLPTRTLTKFCSAA